MRGERQCHPGKSLSPWIRHLQFALATFQIAPYRFSGLRAAGEWITIQRPVDLVKVSQKQMVKSGRRQPLGVSGSAVVGKNGSLELGLEPRLQRQ